MLHPSTCRWRRRRERTARQHELEGPLLSKGARGSGTGSSSRGAGMASSLCAAAAGIAAACR
eukprot:7517408-Pyramimonas_sp.AAC.1